MINVIIIRYVCFCDSNHKKIKIRLPERFSRKYHLAPDMTWKLRILAKLTGDSPGGTTVMAYVVFAQ